MLHLLLSACSCTRNPLGHAVFLICPLSTLIDCMQSMQATAFSRHAHQTTQLFYTAHFCVSISPAAYVCPCIISSLWGGDFNEKSLLTTGHTVLDAQDLSVHLNICIIPAALARTPNAMVQTVWSMKCTLQCEHGEQYEV